LLMKQMRGMSLELTITWRFHAEGVEYAKGYFVPIWLHNVYTYNA
jgi:hypothetical protein